MANNEKYTNIDQVFGDLKFLLENPVYVLLTPEVGHKEIAPLINLILAHRELSGNPLSSDQAAIYDAALLVHEKDMCMLGIVHY